MPRTDIASSGAVDTLLASAARTASGNSGTLAGWGAAKTLRAQVNATAASGTTPTLDVVLEDTINGTDWNTIAVFNQLTGTGRVVANVTTPFTDRIRVAWGIGGTTPSFTFDVLCYSE